MRTEPMGGAAKETAMAIERAEKYCPHCGSVIDVRAEVCPACGVRASSASGGIDQSGYGVVPSRRSRITALLLCLFLGYLGAHRFYVGKIGTGFVWLITFGVFGVGMIVDLVMIMAGTFKDIDDRRLLSG